MKKFIEKLIGRLEELSGKAEQEMNYYRELSEEDASCEVFADSHEKEYEAYCKAMDIVNQLAEEYKPCDKPSCEDCEVYDKENHYCHKWCEVIKHTTSELEEEYNNDVREWRLCDEESNVYDTTCRNPHILIEGSPTDNNYVFCPYCGKKIKVVE